MALDLIEVEAGVNAASFTVTTPSSWTSGDLLHLAVATWGGNTSPSSPPSGGAWSSVGSAEGPANPAASDESTLTVFEHDYTGTPPNLTIPDSGSYQNAALLVYRDVHADVWDVSPSFGTITNTASIAISGITTLTNDALVVVYISLGNDRTVTASDIANATAITLGGAAPTEHLVTQNVSTDGNDSNMIVLVGRMTSAGGTGNVTLTLSAAASGGYMIGALKPAGGGGDTELVVADATSGSTAEAVTLTQAHTLVVADATSGSTAEAVVLTQAHTLAVADAASGSTAEAVTLTQAHVLVVSDATSGSTIDGVTLEIAGSLVVADITSASTIDGVTLTQAHTLVVSDSTSAPTIDGVTLTQAHALTIADATSGSTVDNVTLTTRGDFGDPSFLRVATIASEGRLLVVRRERRVATVDAEDRTIIVKGAL